MATPRKLPFEVRIRRKSADHTRADHTRVLRNFTLDPREADVDETYLLEFVPYELEFAPVSEPPPPDARLYIDGFDALVDEDDVLEVDDDRVYIGCGKSIRIQGEKREGEQDEASSAAKYPWIPGNYRVEVQWGGQTYYTVLNVRPVNLSWTQLEIMRDELERYVVGLTLDIIRKNQGMGRSELLAALPARFYQYQLLQKNFWMIEAAVRDIIRKPKQEVRRTYTVVPAAKNARRDEKSYRWAHSPQGLARNHGLSDQRAQLALAPSSAINYDLPENRWVRRILEDLLELTDDIAAAIHRFSELQYHLGERVQEERNRLLREILYIQSRLRAALSHPIFREVDPGRASLPYTPAMQRDGRYRTLYRFWWDLRNHSKVRVDAAFEYQWKRTDLLWEYWTLVRTIEALKQLGFEPVSGWIFDKGWEFPDRVLIPSISEGTRIVMVRGDERVDIYYADRIPHSRHAAQQVGSLLYVEGAHNCPDLRLDYIREDSYEYSIVIEAKYRPRWRIWSDELAADRRSWTKIMNQLQAYRSVSRRDDSQKRAVREVIAVYPRGNDKLPVYEAWDHITLIRLTPGEPDKHFVDYLGKYWGRPDTAA